MYALFCEMKPIVLKTQPRRFGDYKSKDGKERVRHYFYSINDIKISTEGGS